MKAAHQGAPPQALSTSWSGGWLANAGTTTSAVAAPADPGAPAPPTSIGSGGSGRPAPTQVAQRPAAGGGMDGWLIDKLFGKR
jgi:penicillin-binding protein 1A